MRHGVSPAFAAVAMVVVACSGAPSITPNVTPAATQSQPSATPIASPTRAPTPTAEAGYSSLLLADHPVLVGDDLDPEAEDGYYGATLPATYFTVDGVHHLYVVGFGPGYGVQRVFHAESDDGLEWTIDEADPSESFVDEFSPPGPVPGTVLQTSDGGWVMYFWGTPAPRPAGAQIYRATADDPAGPWTAELEPVLALGEPGDVDDRGLDFPTVVPTEDGFVMLYGAVGGDAPQTARTLLATSSDGVTWEKRGRVLEPDLCGGADINFVGIPRLFTVDDGFLALANMSDDVYAFQSDDAASWTCQSDPVFEASDIEGNDRVHTLAAGRDEENINLVIEALFTGTGGEVTTNLWLAQLTGL